MLKKVVKAKRLTSLIQAVKSRLIKNNKQAFTLLELVVVVLIMGLMYGMVSMSVTKATTTLPQLTAKNIADFLHAQKDTQERSFYLYGNQCNKVSFVPTLDEAVHLDKISFGKDSAAFWFDNYGSMQKINFPLIKTEYFSEPVCLKFEHFNNGSTSPMVIQSGKKFYYHAFFEGLKSFDSLEAASQWIKHAEINPQNLGLQR